jgi:putative nucleotidyltransferase with HDIG domain
MTQIEHDASLAEVLESHLELRPFPACASRILATCDDPHVNPRDISHIIQCDPAVSLRLLQVANSSMYGFAGEIRSIDHAIVVLGLRAVRSLAVAAAAADLFAMGESAQAARQNLWLHSLACGAVAGAVARCVGVATDEAFLGGIIHDVGKLVFFDVVPDQYATLQEQVDSTNIVAHETSAFGVDHSHLGLRCAENWGLPLELNAAIGFHHEPESATLAAQLAAVVCVANSLTRVWSLGGGHGVQDELHVALERTGLSLDAEQLAAIQVQATSDLQTLQETCPS